MHHKNKGTAYHTGHENQFTHLMDTRFTINTRGVWTRAVHTTSHPGSPLLLQQLRHNGLHSLSGLNNKD